MMVHLFMRVGLSSSKVAGSIQDVSWDHSYEIVPQMLSWHHFHTCVVSLDTGGSIDLDSHHPGLASQPSFCFDSVFRCRKHLHVGCFHRCRQLSNAIMACAILARPLKVSLSSVMAAGASATHPCVTQRLMRLRSHTLTSNIILHGPLSTPCQASLAFLWNSHGFHL